MLQPAEEEKETKHRSPRAKTEQPKHLARVAKEIAWGTQGTLKPKSRDRSSDSIIEVESDNSDCSLNQEELMQLME